MSLYRVAVQQTTSAIDARARYFRVAVVAVALVLVVSTAWALWARSFAPLLGMVLVVPVCGAFLSSDQRLLNKWRTELLGVWVDRNLDLAAFRLAMRANAALPKETVEGMLSTLPSVGDLAAEQRLSTLTRRAIAANALATHGSRADTAALKAGGAGLISGTLIAAVALHRWVVLAALLALGFLPLWGAWMNRRRRVSCQREVTACKADPAYSDAEYLRAIGS